MAKKLKAGDAVRGYRITKVFGPGMMAISYGALSAARAKASSSCRSRRADVEHDRSVPLRHASP